MADFFKDWDKDFKYIKKPWHKNIARIGHLEYIMSRLIATSNSIAGKPVIATAPTGDIEGIYAKNTFIYKGTQDGEYQLPDPVTYSTNGVFVINKSEYTLTVKGEIFDFTPETEKDVLAGEIVYFISDGEHWTKF